MKKYLDFFKRLVECFILLFILGISCDLISIYGLEILFGSFSYKNLLLLILGILGLISSLVYGGKNIRVRSTEKWEE